MFWYWTGNRSLYSLIIVSQTITNALIHQTRLRVNNAYPNKHALMHYARIIYTTVTPAVWWIAQSPAIIFSKYSGSVACVGHIHGIPDCSVTKSLSAFSLLLGKEKSWTMIECRTKSMIESNATARTQWLCWNTGSCCSKYQQTQANSTRLWFDMLVLWLTNVILRPQRITQSLAI